MKVTYYRHFGSPEVLFDGRITAADFEHLATSVIDSPKFAGGRGLLIDVSLLKDSYDETQIRGLADAIGQRARRFGDRLAIVVSHGDPEQQADSRLFARHAGEWGVTSAIFFDQIAAHEWLGADVSLEESESEDPTPTPLFEIPDQTHRVLVVEDSDTEREAVARILEISGYDVEAFANPEDALQSFQAKPAEIVVTDQDMPEMLGTDLGVAMMQLRPETRMILVTGRGDEQTAQEAIRVGFHNYLIKPVVLDGVVAAVREALLSFAQDEYAREMDEWLRAEVRRQTKAVREVSIAGMSSLVNALEARSPNFEGHSRAVAECAAGIARTLGLPVRDVERIGIAGLLHDVGMIGIPDSVVEKPGGLTREERAAIETHPQKGFDILRPLTHLGEVLTYVLEHHERIDGSGYPFRKSGDEISLGGQIVGLAETWTALTEPRAFRDRMSEQDALETLAATGGSWYRDDLIRALRTWRRE